MKITTQQPRIGHDTAMKVGHFRIPDFVLKKQNMTLWIGPILLPTKKPFMFLYFKSVTQYISVLFCILWGFICQNVGITVLQLDRIALNAPRCTRIERILLLLKVYCPLKDGRHQCPTYLLLCWSALAWVCSLLTLFALKEGFNMSVLILFALK